VFNDISRTGDAGAAGNVADGATVAALLALADERGIPRLDAEVLLAALSGTGRAQLIAFPERPVAPLAAAMFDAGLVRLAAGEPLAYITGVREFWSLPLVVMPDVLIPRPETELLVELCLNRLDASPHRIVDLGTGSGAIALALARERPDWLITATDASPAALQVASINRERLHISNVNFRAGRWCDALGIERFDAILSNPPYVAAGDPALTQLGFEPQQALVASDEGYSDLLAIISSAHRHLQPGGMLLLEHGATQGARLATALVAQGYDRVACHRDLAGHDRVTEAYWPHPATESTRV
jgi:release factor glutamine methyltransferase